MAQAAQEDRGVESLTSNLPQSYTGGGIIAFEGGGKVERYQNTGFTGTAQVGQLGYDQLMKLFQTDPQLAKEAALRAGPTGARFLAALGTGAQAANMALIPTAAGLPATMFATGVTGGMSPEQRAGMYSNPMVSAMSGDTGIGAAIQNAPNMEKPTMGSGEQIMNALSFFPKTLISAPGDKANPKGYGLTRLFAPNDAPPAVAPTATPAATGPIIPYGQSKVNLLGGNTGGAGAGGGAGGGGGFKMPVLQGFTPSDTPTLEDYHNITKELPKKLQDASEKAVKATQSQLEEFDKPLEAKGARLEGREAQLAKDSEISRWLAVVKGGIATLGGTSKNAAENIGKGFNVGIDEAIRGEAANRAAKDRLEDAKDRFDEQKIAAKKGNLQAAQQAGQRAADDLRQATQLTMTGAHYGNTEALNRYQTEQQGRFQQASLDQSGKLGIAGLMMQDKQLAQTGAFQQAQLAANEKRFAAMDKASQARMMQVRATAFGKFNETVAPQLNAQLTSEYGKNWRTAQDPRSLQAQTLFKQAQNAYIIDALGQHDASSGARSAEGLLGLGD